MLLPRATIPRPSEIVKVTLTDQINAPAIISDNKHERIRYMRLPPPIKHRLHGDAIGFFLATWDGIAWHLGKRIKDEDW